MANFVYLVGNKEKREAFIVDPAWRMDTIFQIAKKENLKVVGAVVTHSHFDHCNGIKDLLAQTNVPIYIQKEEANFAKSFGNEFEFVGFLPEENLNMVGHGDKIKVGNIEIKFLHTPGHTPGSQCLLIEDNLISGDTLFVRGCGRCDLPGSDPKKMYESLTQILMKLPDSTTIFPGHNYADKTTSCLAEEKNKNPFLACNSFESFMKMIGG